MLKRKCLLQSFDDSKILYNNFSNCTKGLNIDNILSGLIQSVIIWFSGSSLAWQDAHYAVRSKISQHLEDRTDKKILTNFIHATKMVSLSVIENPEIKDSSRNWFRIEPRTVSRSGNCEAEDRPRGHSLRNLWGFAEDLRPISLQ